MWGLKKVLLGAAGVAFGTLSMSATAAAQAVPDDGFYKGKQIQFLTYSASGGRLAGDMVGPITRQGADIKVARSA